MDENRIDPGHQAKGATLRRLGWIVLCVGIVLLVAGACMMFSLALVGLEPSRGSVAGHMFGGFAMTAIGIVCLAVGGAMLQFGYAGKVARYMSAEAAPVAKDTLNYVAENMSQGIHDVTAAVSSGIRDGFAAPSSSAAPTSSRPRVCPSCGVSNPPVARFCNQCGRGLAPPKASERGEQ